MLALLISFEDISTRVGLGTADLKTATINVVNLVLGLLGLVAVFFFLLGAYDWLIAGDSEVVRIRARRIMIGALAGLIVILLAWAIVNFTLKTTANLSGA